MTRPEFSRPVRLDTLGGEPRVLDVAADAGERAALAARFGLVDLAALSATVTLLRDGERIGCEGRLRATVTQACVATGESLPATVDEPFALRFVPARDGPGEEELELETDQLDEVDYAGGAVDVGEAVAETLALALDPFPRAPGADAALRAAGVLAEGEAGPFAALKALKDRL